MSVTSTSSGSVHACRWEWCRDIFDTADRLAKHVLDDHIAKEMPVKREDIRLEMRAFDGTSIGEDSIRTSLLMNEDPFIDDEEKESDIPGPSNITSAESPIHQDTSENAVAQEHSPGHNSPILSQPGRPALPSHESDMRARLSSMSPGPLRTPSPSPARNGFRALAAASSCSPDPLSLAVAPSPSIAELLANTLNNVYQSNYTGISGPNTVRRADFPGQSKPSSSSRPIGSPSSSSAREKRKSAELQSDERSQPLNGNGSSSYSRPASRSHTRTLSSSSRKDLSRADGEVPTLSPISEATGTNIPQNGSHSVTQNLSLPISSTRPFRSGSIRLEPNPSGTANVSQPSHTDTVPHIQHQAQPESQLKPIPPPEPDGPPSSANPYLEDIDMLPSSLEHSVPTFTQIFDMQNQTQWPLATQAPYSFDSQLASTSQ